jgi:hypothetical protein
MTHDEKHESLLDVTLKKYPRDSMRKLFNLRLFLVSKVTETATKDMIRGYLGKWMGQAEVDPIYGLSFLYPGSTIHLLQASSEKMYDFLHALVRDKDEHGMWPFRILISTDNVMPDTIKFYESAQIDSMKQDFFTANAAIEMSIAEVYNALLGLAELLSAMGDVRRTDAMQNLLREYFKYLPADFRVLGFAENVELTTLDEYLSIYDCPILWTPLLENVLPAQWRHDLTTIERISEIETDDPTQSATK